MDHRRALTIAAILLCPASVVVVLLTGLWVGAPGNVWFVALGYLIGPLALLYFLAPSIAFKLLVLPLSRGEIRLRWWSLLLFALAVVAVGVYLAGSWRYGEKYQGDFACQTLAYANAAAGIVLGVIALRNRRRPTARTNFFFHFLIVLWLFTFAFPYLGEML